MVDRVRINGRINPGLMRLDELLLPTRETIKRAVQDGDQTFRKGRARTFATEGVAAGERWQSLSDRYKKRKAKLRPGKKILVFDGNLRRSLTSKASPEHRATALRSSKNRRDWVLRWGTSNRLAAYHGPSRFHNPRLPIRDAMAFSDKQALEMLGTIRRVFLRDVDTRGIRALRQSQQFFGTAR